MVTMLVVMMVVMVGTDADGDRAGSDDGNYGNGADGDGGC